MGILGVLGGSFDPVHLGHLSLAADALAQAGLDEVLFMPVHRQPFKLDTDLAEDSHRLAMLRAAVLGKPGFRVSDLEIRSGGISYTYLTLRKLREGEGETRETALITGTDSFLKIHTWKNAGELLTENIIIVGSRPGYKEEALRSQAESLRGEYGARIRIIENRRLDISATEIRRRVREGLPIGDLVPPAVERYIDSHGLYHRTD
jgi:nicotinate-nucleotide adenylyltransferase